MYMFLVVAFSYDLLKSKRHACKMRSIFVAAIKFYYILAIAFVIMSWSKRDACNLVGLSGALRPNDTQDQISLSQIE